MESMEFQIARLQLRAGETLVIKSERVLSAAQSDLLIGHVKPLLPAGVKALVIDGGISLEVLAQGEGG